MQAEGKGRVLDQFSNDDNWAAHFEGTGPELWRQTEGTITHFVSAMGTTGTITGVSRYLKARNPQVQIVGAQPEEGSSIAGIRKWAPEYLPAIYRHAKVDRLEYVSQQDAEEMARQMAVREGIFCGISAAGACIIALRVAEEWRLRMSREPSLQPATIVFVVCDRGDRYLSTGVFPGVTRYDLFHAHAFQRGDCPRRADHAGLKLPSWSAAPKLGPGTPPDIAGFKPPAGHRKPVKGVVLMICAVTLFSVMDTGAKYLSESYPVVMVAWARFFFNVAIMVVVLGPGVRPPADRDAAPPASDRPRGLRSGSRRYCSSARSRT
jgi:hypothetical protein